MNPKHYGLLIVLEYNFFWRTQLVVQGYIKLVWMCVTSRKTSTRANFSYSLLYEACLSVSLSCFLCYRQSNWWDVLMKFIKSSCFGPRTDDTETNSDRITFSPTSHIIYCCEKFLRLVTPGSRRVFNDGPRPPLYWFYSFLYVRFMCIT